MKRLVHHFGDRVEGSPGKRRGLVAPLRGFQPERFLCDARDRQEVDYYCEYIVLQQ